MKETHCLKIWSVQT